MSSEYARKLVLRDKDRRQLREQLLAGIRSPVAGAMDTGYFASLRRRLHKLVRQPSA